MAQLWINGKEQDGFVKKNDFWIYVLVQITYVPRIYVTDCVLPKRTRILEVCYTSCKNTGEISYAYE